MKRKANDMGMTVINDAVGLNFSELNSEAFKNMMNSIVNDGINLDENETSNRNIMSKKAGYWNKYKSCGLYMKHRLYKALDS